MAASYEARAYGVRSGMPAAKARRLCPDLLVAGSSFERYSEASKAIFAIFRRYTDIVQAGSMEEAFLDVSGSGEDGAELAAQLRADVRAEAGLPLSVGVARTKVLAKIASRQAKPDGLFVVPEAGELEFLHGLTVDRIWGVGPATTAKLHGAGLRYVGEAAELSEADLMGIVGKAAGRYVHTVANNREFRRVHARRGRRSFGAQRALGRGPRTPAELEAALSDLAERLAKRMARKGRAGRTVVLRLRFGDYTRATRSHTLGEPTAEPSAIAGAACGLLDGALPLVRERGITLVGLTVTNLAGEATGHQLGLFGEDVAA